MLDITYEQLDKLYKSQQGILKRTLGISAALCATAYFMYRGLIKRSPNGYVPFEDLRPLFIVIVTALVAASFIIIASAKNKLIPVGHTENVSNAAAYLQNDFTSDGAVNMLYQKIGSAKTFPEKAKLLYLLSNVYMFRGQYKEAIDILNSVDRSQFKGYPTIGMEYYDNITGLYYCLGDNDSVIAAYNDAEPFIAECSKRNYLCCSTAVNILICANKAKGNYSKALQIRLMKNDFENKISQTITADSQGTPLSKFIKGMSYFESAELFCLNGDYKAASEALDAGGPLLAPSVSETNRANELSAKIREALAQKI